MKNSSFWNLVRQFFRNFVNNFFYRFLRTEIARHFYDTHKKKLISNQASYINIPTKCTHDLKKI